MYEIQKMYQQHAAGGGGAPSVNNRTTTTSSTITTTDANCNLPPLQQHKNDCYSNIGTERTDSVESERESNSSWSQGKRNMLFICD